jgi:hypothetical protein
MHIELKLVLTLVLSLSLFYVLQKLHFTSLKNRTINLLDAGFIRARLDLALRIFAFSLCLALPPLLLFSDVFSLLFPLGICITFCVVASVLISPELTLYPGAKLIITKALFSNTVYLHLAQPYQDFDRQTYQELLQLVSRLPAYRVRQIMLSSPMFYDSSGKLRSFTLLETLLTRKGATLSSSKAKMWNCLLGKLSLLTNKDLNKKEKSKKINLIKWHILYIRLAG